MITMNLKKCEDKMKNYNFIFIIFVMLIFNVVIVFGSERSFDYNIYINDTVNPTDNSNIGRFVITPTIINPKNITLDKINGSYILNDTIYQGDYIVSVFGSIILNGQFVQKDVPYLLNDVGTLNFYDALLTNNTGIITVNQLNGIPVNINENSNFDVEFNLNNFFLT